MVYYIVELEVQTSSAWLHNSALPFPSFFVYLYLPILLSLPFPVEGDQWEIGGLRYSLLEMDSVSTDSFGRREAN
jgi:hypothetical protein